MAPADLPIFLDYNATTPCAPEVLEKMIPFLTTHFGNPASKSHAYGWLAEEAVDEAREKVAKLIGASSQQIIFTSGATEAINLAIRGMAEQQPKKSVHLISFQSEHKAVLDCLAFLEQSGHSVTLLPVDSNGRPNLSDLRNAIRPETRLVAMMLANNETGTIMPVDEVGQICREAGLTFFCDATQAAGKIPIDVKKSQISLLALSGHKFYGPKGVGALYLTNGVTRPTPLQFGGGHEKGLRSGTLNVPGIVGLGKASELALNQIPSSQKKFQTLKESFLGGLNKFTNTSINGGLINVLPNTINVCFDFNGGERLMDLISSKVAVSRGSACSSAISKPSHVLKSIGLSDGQAYRSIRFSFGRTTTETEIAHTLEIIESALKSLKI
ncbi:MAG: cysteine desulfurase family protein [Cyclobacteriaceae bacterium]